MLVVAYLCPGINELTSVASPRLDPKKRTSLNDETKNKKSTENRQQYKSQSSHNDEFHWGYKLVPKKIVQFLESLLHSS